jgi:hypothetical protein
MSGVQISLVILSWVFVWWAGAAHGYWTGWDAHKRCVEGQDI